jgi:hypothetical protein
MNKNELDYKRKGIFEIKYLNPLFLIYALEFLKLAVIILYIVKEEFLRLNT